MDRSKNKHSRVAEAMYRRLTGNDPHDPSWQMQRIEQIANSVLKIEIYGGTFSDLHGVNQKLFQILEQRKRLAFDICSGDIRGIALQQAIELIEVYNNEIRNLTQL